SNPGSPRFQFKIDPKSPLKELLPVPPDSKIPVGPVIAKDLTQVPEVQFQLPLDKKLPSPEGLKQTAHTIAKINHLNEKKTVGFLDALRQERVDLTGLPFAMGDACRTKGERSKQFAKEVAMVRAALQQSVGFRTMPHSVTFFPGDRPATETAPAPPQAPTTGLSVPPPPAVSIPSPTPPAQPTPPLPEGGGSAPAPSTIPAPPTPPLAPATNPTPAPAIGSGT